LDYFTEEKEEASSKKKSINEGKKKEKKSDIEKWCLASSGEEILKDERFEPYGRKKKYDCYYGKEE